VCGSNGSSRLAQSRSPPWSGARWQERGWRGGTHTEAATSACRDGGQRVENVTSTVVLSAALATDNNSALASLNSLPNARPKYLEYNDARDYSPKL